MESGYVSAIKTRNIGLAIIGLGGGRRLASDKVDHSVGFTKMLGKNARVEKGQALALVHARDEASAAIAIKSLQACYQLGDKVEVKNPVFAHITAST
jgi:thymidine phosphorylase